MPTYEYKCTVCADHFDIEQSITEDTLTSLTGCAVADDGDHKLKKVFSAVGISFKGDGFYRNDSRSSNKTSGSDPSSSNGGTNGSSDSSSSTSSSSSSAESGSSSSTSDSSSGSKESKASAGSSSSAD
ncbi:MAG: FmdB family transcriptional regulator [Acidimicrobiia bacterium]|nr:FmdB family transcriptional regulator [Acidimicrobiia bacterium]